MPSDSGSRSSDELTRAEQRRLDALAAAESLADLVRLTGADSEHDAYFAAKREWKRLRGRADEAAGDRPSVADEVPGDRVTVGDTTFHVHGITHAGTEAERTYLVDRVGEILDAGGAVYCEQGIRSMYFESVPAVCEMDDYEWAMERCRERTSESHLVDASLSEFDGLSEEVDSVRSRIRDAVFGLVESGSDVYGREFERVLGDLASQFLVSHEQLATGDDFEAYRISRAAATDPGRLPELQAYYRRAFLPQPVEREWLRRHDPELEVVTHARNERMADYAVYHADEAADLHLVVGAAHQPGVTYYLRRHRDGYRSLDGFALVG